MKTIHCLTLEKRIIKEFFQKQADVLAKEILFDKYKEINSEIVEKKKKGLL